MKYDRNKALSQVQNNEFVKTHKGERGYYCNRSACLEPNAIFYNHSTQKWYCPKCAQMINQQNKDDAQRLFDHDLCTLEGPKVN